MGVRSLSGGKLQVVLQATLNNTLLDGSAAAATIGGTIYSKSLTNGVGALQGNRGWQCVNRVLAAGQSEVIDLYDFASIDLGAGAGKDGLGQACAFEELVALAVVHVSGAGLLEINASLPHDPVSWVGAQTVANGGAMRAGGLRLFAETGTDGLDIQDGLSNKIKLTANGGDVTYSIYVLAKSDDDDSSSSSQSVSSVSSRSSSSSSESSLTNSLSSGGSSLSSQSSLSSLSSSSRSSSSNSSSSQSASSVSSTA